LVNWKTGGEFSFYWSINERLRGKFKLSTLLRLEWSPLISFIEDINSQKWSFCWKKDLSTYKVFLWKDGRSFQTWEDKNNWPASKTRFCRMLLLKTATNSSNNGYFSLNVTWRVTWPVRSTNSALKCSGRQNLTVC